ncbi:PAS domain S-box protein [Phenylobacterium sp. LjRoot225]|uniref:HWE histidine kinase domain-containing protein n=1 Tax=Phenylobacterium sp. LjRoot225 TaxID=3342285 RepID=UPI003ED14AE7
MTAKSPPRPTKPGPILKQLLPGATRGPLVRWTGALAAFLASLSLRLLVSDVMPPGVPFVTFFPAVMAAAFWAGAAPAIVVAVLSGLAAWFLILTPGAVAVTPGTMTAMAFFACVCAMLIWLTHRLTTERGAHAAREAQLRAIMDTVPVGIALYDLPSGRILDGSRYMERMVQRPVLNSPDIHAYAEWVCYHADGSRVAVSEYPLARIMLENAEAPELEAHYQRGDGARIWIRIMGRPIRDAHGEVTGGVIAIVDIDAERRAQQEAQRLADEFRALADNIPTLCWMARPDGHIYWYNQRWHDYTGSSATRPEGWRWAEVHDPAFLPSVQARWARSLETGEPFEMTFPLKGVDGVFRPFLTRVVPIRNSVGQVTRWFGVNIEVSAQQRHEQQQQVLINELNHRVKNTLATVQSIAAQTLRSGADPGEVFQNFEARLLNLSDAHNLLTQRSWEGASVGELVERASRPFKAAERTAIEAHGPSVWLKSESALGLAMALHELVTNAAKHGALSTEAGRVEIRWTCEPQTGAFQLNWTERGGPAVARPGRRGFGLRLIERALAGEIRARSQLDFRSEGLVCTINATLPATALPSAA